MDAAAFFVSYPLSVHVDGEPICHLASQTRATLLLLQRLPPTVVTIHDINVLEKLFDELALRALRRADALIEGVEKVQRQLPLPQSIVATRCAQRNG